jgi:hypothetical protein
VEIGIGGLIIVAAKKWGLREAYVMIAIGVLGTLICVGMVLSSGKSIATMTIVQVAVVTGMLVVWAHIFYGMWRDARVAGSAKPMIAASASAGQQRPEAKEIQVGMIPVVHDAWDTPSVTQREQGAVIVGRKWLRWPKTPQSPLATTHTARVLLKSHTGGQFQIDSIGMIRQVFIEYLEQPTKHWECTCAVDFHEVGSPVEASPLQLVLTGRDGLPELAILTAEHLPTRAGFVRYTGTANREAMPTCIEQAMGDLMKAHVPPDPNTYCYVEVHVAPGQRIAHQKTTVRLDHELAGRQFHYFFVPLVFKYLKNEMMGFALFVQRLQEALK